MTAKPPQHTDLLLIGGGHSHLAVIKQLGMQPVAGLRITVISKDVHTPYSGMMPGLLAGHYCHDDAHIDLRKLCQWAGIRLFHSTVTDINLDRQLVYCDNRTPVRYDWLSINIGSQPDLSAIDGADTVGIRVKPIESFLNDWRRLTRDLQQRIRPMRLAVVGGGAASVEVALAIHYQLQQQFGNNARQIRVELICGTERLLSSHNRRVQHSVTQLLAKRNIALMLHSRVIAARIAENRTAQLVFADGSTHCVDEVIWAVHAGSPQWPQQTGLHCNANGFINVNHYLQSTSHSNVFAAGDIAHFDSQPVAKSGVIAVRSGPVLSDNLRAAITGTPLRAYRPQRRFLSLLMTGNQSAIASWGPFNCRGRWVWRWKDAIDRRFMANYRDMPPMNAKIISAPTATSEPSSMRCGGCGAKIGHTVLQRVIAKLEITESPDVLIGLNTPDDAAVIEPPAGKTWLQTVDYFRAFIDDPYLLGRIATNHCLSDIYAMGGTPHSALAIATVPYASDKLLEDTLLQLMSGAVDSLNQQRTALIGGHSSEGSELGFGLSVNGTIEQTRLLTKGALDHGQVLILTKPLGTGTLLAANGQGLAQGRWIENALQYMLISNCRAADIIYQHGASACTDVTGFGLLGHLIEMLAAANIGAYLQLDRLPVLEGAVDCAANGWLSSLQPNNLRAANTLINGRDYLRYPYYPLLFDPQTAGGLLAALPAANADTCLEALQRAGYPQAAIIGSIDQQQPIANVQLC